MFTYVGYVAAILTTISFIPQVIKSHKAKNLSEISLQMYILFTSGIFLWLVYGLVINSLPIIIANAITFVLAAYILYLKIKKG